MSSAKKKNASKMKQGNLFSFFSKVSPKNKNNTSSAGKPSPIATKATSTPSSASQKSSTNAVVRRPSESSAVGINFKWKKVKLGMKLAVHWPDDNKYYPAVVEKVASDNKSRFFLQYDDGDEEWIDLRQEKFRFIDDDMDTDVEEEMEEEEEQEQIPKQNGKKRPRIHDSDDEEFEFEDVLEEVDDDEEMEYVDEKEDADDQLVDSGDEEEDPPRKPKKRADKMKANKKPKITEHTSTTKVTPKASKTSSSTTETPTTATLTPVSLESFSAFSASKPTNEPRRVTPPSSTRTPASANALADAADTWDGERALLYTRDEVNPAGSHVHHHLKFLRKPDLKDAQGRSPDDPEYSPRTLKVDIRELKQHYNTAKNKNKELSPGVAQWWDIKAQYFDTVLLFKMGKFYELYHMDCDIGVHVCGLQYMKGHIAHCGFPEISYGGMADKLVRAGYKVARVEQTETPEMLKVRKKNTPRGPKAPKVVNREVCSIMSMGTRTYCYLDGELASDFCPEESGVGPLLVIKEVQLGKEDTQHQQGDDEDALVPTCEYGIVVVDAARGVITIGQFADDVLRSRMITLLTTFNPSEVLVEGGEDGASASLRALLKSLQTSSSAKFCLEKISPVEIFPKSTAVDASIQRKLNRNNGKIQPWNVQETLEEFHRREYFPRASKEPSSKSISRWPKILQLAVEGNAELALAALGAALFYLQRGVIDEAILSMGVFDAYCPPASPIVEEESNLTKASEAAVEASLHEEAPTPTIVGMQEQESLNEEDKVTHMSIDGNTLVQLEILTNSLDNQKKGSLSWFIDYTKTPHGARLLRAWLLRPLFRKADIDRRADAVEELLSGDTAMAMHEASRLLSKCGDLERMISAIHGQSGVKFPDEEGSNSQPNTHPDTRAVLYEGKTYTKRKVGNFDKVIKGLRSCSRIPGLFADIQIQSPLLKKLVNFKSNGGGFPDISDDLNWFDDNIDLEKAAEGEFVPGRGVDAAFDNACDEIARIHAELERYKDEMCSTVLVGNARNSWKYANTKLESKDKYTVELPAAIQVPPDFKMIGKRGSGTKQINKYNTPQILELVKDLERAIDLHKERKARQLQVIFAKFDSKRHLWNACAIATATLDALASLAELGKKPGYCRPAILDCHPNASPSINISQGRHPCVEKTFSGEFIPNDLVLGPQEQGEQSAMVLLLSGPNMGGKSTLLRQTCLICILAQMGAMVPAESCSLTPVDVMMTRLGASDRILLGQSTFFVELAETAAALRGATRRSLILFDELGRGTSSFDGTAIASACLSYICTNLKCLCLFATHYHSLLDEKKTDPNVRLAHMESTVNEEDEETDNITFLYTLGDGACPKSFGINVARLACLPEEVLEKAQKISADFEMEMNGDARHTIAPGEAAKQKEDLVEMINTCNGNSMEKIEAMWDRLQSEN